MCEALNCNVLVNDRQSLADFLTEYRSTHLNRLEDRIRELARDGEGVALLRAAGFSVSLETWNAGYVLVRVGKEELSHVRKVLGRLELAGKDVYDAEQGEVEVTLSAKRYHHIRVAYRTRLGNGRCRIVQETKQVSKLVCGV
jgi:hypothetical protein